MIEIDLVLPLPGFTLRVAARLPLSLTAIMGPSGAGKTSLLEAVAGLRPGASGRIVLQGQTVLDRDRGICLPPDRRLVGYVPQDAGLFPHLTARQNVAFGVRDGGALAETAIDTLEIRPLLDRPPAMLSGGERQRVALARALAIGPRVLLLDEPLASLDVPLRERIVPFLLRIRDEWRVPILYVTHNAGEALSLAAQVLLLRDGAVEAQGTPLEVLATPSFSREAEAGMENLLSARVIAHDERGGITRMEVTGGPALSVPLSAGRAVGSTVTLVIRAEDILVATEEQTGLSARNVYRARILSVSRTGVDETLRCALVGSSAVWLVRLTPAAVLSLGLVPEREIFLAVKSHSVRVA